MEAITPHRGQGEAALRLPPSVEERYRPRRVLKSGAGVTTYLAESPLDGSEVVLKLADLATVGAAAGMRLSHEASVLATLNGPGGGQFLLDHGTDDGFVWLAARYLDGRSLAEELARGPVSVDATLRVAAGVLTQLVVAHAHSVVHRDVKPANIVVQGDVSNAVLIDFGLSRSVHLDPSLQEVPVGTVRYCSPEQAGLIDQPCDERTDLYSLGLTLYECLTGHPVLDGSTVGQVLRQHLAPKSPVSDSVPGVPRAVSELIGRLLQVNPESRYQTADAVLVDVEAIRRARQRGEDEPTLVIGAADRRNSLADPGFVGRHAELALLESQLLAAEHGGGTLVYLEGESGGGKSRLLDEFTRRCTAKGVLVLRGYGEAQTATRPFQIFEGVTTGLARAAGEDAQLADRLRAALAEQRFTAATVAPYLCRQLWPDSPLNGGGAGVAGGLVTDKAASMPEEHGQTRSAAVLSAILDASGSVGQPAVVILDDCQWSQVLTSRVLAQWAATPGTRHVLVVAAFRADEVPVTSPIRDVPARSIRLASLSANDLAALVSSMAGRLAEAARDTIVRLSGGNAFMAQAVLRGMVETGALRSGSGGWELDPTRSDQVSTSRQAALYLLQRLEALPSSARTLLETAAVIGKVADLDLAVTMSGLSAAEAIPALDELTRRRILWLDESSGRARFTHDMIRETILDNLDGSDRSRLHLEIARFFTAEAASSSFQAAYHLYMGGEAGQAYPYAIQAAEAARSRHALEEAESYYRMAASGARTDGERFMVWDGLGEVLTLAGRYSEAEGAFSEAASLAPTDRDRAALIGKRGEVAFRCGDQVAACRELEDALRRLGAFIPRRRGLLVVMLVWELLVQAAHTVTGNRLTRRATPDELDRLKLRFLSRLAYAYWFRNGRLRCMWVHLREMNQAERIRSAPEMAQAYSEHGPAMTMLPWYGRGIDYVRRSLALRTELGDVWGQGQSKSFYGVALYGASRYREAVEVLEDSVRILSITGDRWEMNTALWSLALTHYRLGDWGRAAGIADDVLRSATRIGDKSSAGIAMAVQARVSSGHHPAPKDVDAAIATGGEDQHTAAELRLAKALQLSARGHNNEAAEELAAAWDAVCKAGLRQEYVAPVLPWLATAQRQAGLKRLHRRTAHKALRLARSYKNNLPHALREVGLAEAHRGRPGRCRRFLERSILVAVEQGAAWEEACSRMELGRIGLVLGWDGAAEQFEMGKARTAAIEAEGRGVRIADTARSSLSAADRFATLLESGREIAAATTTAAVLKEVSEAASRLLRLDQCFVIPIDEAGKPLQHGSASWPEVVLTSAIEEAVSTGRVVRRQASSEAVGVDSMVLAGIRSLMCAPVIVGQRAVAVLYATHREVSALFGQDEEQVASFLTSLAGAAIEHVEGSQAYWKALIENAQDVTVVLDGDANVVYVSPSSERILGRSAGDDGHRLEAVHTDDQERLWATWAAAMAHPGEPRHIEIRLLHADGSWRWCELTMSNRLADETVSGVVLNLRDITSRRAAEQAAADAAARFMVAFDHAPIGMALVDHKGANTGRIIIANEALARMVHRPARELGGAFVNELIHPDHADQLRQARRAFTGGEDTTDGELRMMAGPDKWIWVQYSSTVIRDKSGSPDYFIAQLVDVTEQRQAAEQLAHQALHDPLTGLPNRRLFLERLEQAVPRATRAGRHVAVLFLDLDRFKVINDSYGHATGDEVLIEVSRRLQILTRTSDTLARLGGDEFVVLAEDLDDPAEAPAIAQRIEDALSRPLTIRPGVTVTVSTSIGINLANPGAAPSDLLRDADTALYRAKDLGRGRHEVFGDHLRQEALGRMHTEQELRAAVDEGSLELRYDPVTDMRNGRTVGLDATVLYRSDGRLVPRTAWSDVATETGLTERIDRWTLSQACRQLAIWQERFADDRLTVCLQISPSTFTASGFVDFLTDVIDRSGIKANTVALGITELAVPTAFEAGGPVLSELREFGCLVGIDDFGTGHSSLARLRDLPVDYLRIDESFLRDAAMDPTVLTAVITLAKTLPVGAFATGVATEDQERLLLELGCHLAQGRRYGRPRRPEDVVIRR